MSSAEVLQELAGFRAAMDAVIADVSRGDTTIAEVMARRASEPAISYLYVVKVIEADERIGKVKARRLIEELGGGETTKIGDLTPTQVEEILAGLNGVV
jgi:hypothetical protein